MFLFFSSQQSVAQPQHAKTPTKYWGLAHVCAHASLSFVLNKQEIISSIYCCCVSNGCLHRQIKKKERREGDSSSAIKCQLPTRMSFGLLFFGHDEHVFPIAAPGPCPFALFDYTLFILTLLSHAAAIVTSHRFSAEDEKLKFSAACLRALFILLF